MEQTVMTKYIRYVLVLTTAVVAAACTMTDASAPPLAGPSEMSLSLVLTANPDVLSLDGASQTRIDVKAFDQNGQPKAGVPFRIEILADGQVVDFGSISARTLTTGSNGTNFFTYTAPGFVDGPIPDVQVSVTPTGPEVGFDAAAHLRRVISIKLVPPGFIGGAPTARFTALPTTVAAFADVRFDGSTSTAGLGAVITSSGYVWDFGDGTSGTGITATHRYTTPGTYLARLTVTDSNGLSDQSDAQAITVGAGTPPTARFAFSPASPRADETVFFNGTTSTASAGHQIVRYDWDFGTGSRRSGSTVSRSYDAPGAYAVVLTVTDEVGQTGQITQTVTVSAAATPVASFTSSPTNAFVGTQVNFNASASTAPTGSTIRSYAWDFGDGATAGASSSNTTQHQFSAAGTYVVTLTIVDSEGRRATTTRNVTIQ
jgi:PKD repeat protein